MSSALIDTNLLVLLVVGATDRNLIGAHRRARSFIPRDYDEFLQLLAGFDLFWITSHCLAETSNLLAQTDEKKARTLLSGLSRFCMNTRESHLSRERIFADRNFLRLGVADTGFVQKSRSVTCTFTMDVQLYETISRLGRKVINFNHVRAPYLVS